MDTKKMTQRSKQAMQRRKELLQAAKELFAQNGYHATSTRSINQEIGMADGLIYHYFPNGKKQILESILEEEAQTKITGFAEELQKIDPDLPLREILYRLGKIILHYATKDRDLLIIFLRENHLLHEDFVKPYMEMKMQLMKRIGELLANKMENGEIKKLDVMLMILQFVSPFTLYIIQQAFSVSDASGVPLPEEEAFLNLIVDHTVETWRHC